MLVFWKSTLVDGGTKVLVPKDLESRRGEFIVPVEKE
jgi:hypothetical protein